MYIKFKVFGRINNVNAENYTIEMIEHVLEHCNGELIYL